MMKAFLMLVWLLFAGYGLAQFEHFQVFLLDDDGYEQGLLGHERDEVSGFSFSAVPQTLENPPLVGKEQASIRVSPKDNPSFRIGDYVVICFSPQQDMYVRILDTTPAGKTHQLYPEEDMGVLVSANTYYCAGDRQSDVLIYADESSGLGEGKLYLYGSSENIPLSAEADWALPSGQQSGYDFASEPNTGQSQRQGDGQHIYEAWLLYRFEGP